MSTQLKSNKGAGRSAPPAKQASAGKRRNANAGNTPPQDDLPSLDMASRDQFKPPRPAAHGAGSQAAAAMPEAAGCDLAATTPRRRSRRISRGSSRPRTSTATTAMRRKRATAAGRRPAAAAASHLMVMMTSVMMRMAATTKVRYSHNNASADRSPASHCASARGASIAPLDPGHNLTAVWCRSHTSARCLPTDSVRTTTRTTLPSAPSLPAFGPTQRTRRRSTRSHRNGLSSARDRRQQLQARTLAPCWSAP